MSFKVKRVANRIIATTLVTITLLTIVPFGVFAPINAFADKEDLISIGLTKPKKEGDIFFPSIKVTSDWLGADPKLSSENVIENTFKDSEGGINGMLDVAPAIAYSEGGGIGLWSYARHAYLFIPYNDGDIVINNQNKNGNSAILASTTFNGNDQFAARLAPEFSGINTNVSVTKDNALKFLNGIKCTGGVNAASGNYSERILINGDWALAITNGYIKCTPELLDGMLMISTKYIEHNNWGDRDIWLRKQKYESSKYNGESIYTKVSIEFEEKGNISLIDDKGKLKIPLVESNKFKVSDDKKEFTFISSSGQSTTLRFNDNPEKYRYNIYVGEDKIVNESILSTIYNKGFEENDFIIVNRLCNDITTKLENKLVELEKIKDKEDEEVKDEITSEDTSKIIDALADGKAMEAWMLLINNFFNTGHTKIMNADKEYLGITDDYYYKTISVIDLANYGHVFIKDEFLENESGARTMPTFDSAEVLGDIGSLRAELKNDNDKINKYRVTPYEDLLIRIYYNTQRQYRYIKDEEDRRKNINDANDKHKLDSKFAINSSFSLTEDPLGVPNSYYKDMTDTYTAGPVLDNEIELKGNAEAAATGGFGKLGSDELTPNVKTLAKNFDAAVRYMTYGIVAENAVDDYATDSTQDSTIKVPYCEASMKVIPSLDLNGGGGNSESSDTNTTIMTESVDFSSFGLPDLKNIPKIINNEFARGKISQMYMSLMYIKKYAALTKEKDDTSGLWKVTLNKSIGGLQLSEDEVFDNYDDLTVDNIENRKIEEFLLSLDGLSDEERKKKAPNSETGSYIKAYISIHDGMDYIGLSKDDEWVSVELKRIYEYYDEIKDFKDAVADNSYDEELEADQPFREFFDLVGNSDNNNERMLGKYINMGIAASATYLPLVTNTFDYEAVSIIEDPDFIEEFHYKYGFHRKALFIDSNSNAALQSYVTGQKDSLKVATLEDMMQPDKDIVLYIDPNFYNIKTLAEKQNLSYSKLQNTEEASKKEQGLLEGVADMWSEWRNLDAASICKTAGANLYSDALGSNAVQAYGTDKEQHNFWDAKSKNHYVLSSDAIDEYYKADEYSDVQSFAFVSGIYRCADLLNICQRESANPKPVFVSSPTLPFVEGITKKEFNSIYNYLMVKNLKANLGLDYKTELDLSSPLFIDVYGNISTQSGLVVIPAASNATLYEPSKYSIVTAGLASLVNNADSWNIPIDSHNVEKMIDSGFVKDINKEVYKMQNKSTETIENLNFTNLPLQSDTVRKNIYIDAYAVCSNSGVTEGDLFNQRVNMIMEVMRGAPIENINFDDEGLSGFRNLDKTGIYIAYRIEQLGDMLLSSSEGNSLLKMPNLAFMEGIEYVVVIVFKILLACGVFLLWFKLYADGMSNNLGIRTGIDFMVSIASVVIGIIVIPTLINFSYYQTNKQLLQNEAAYLMMLNTEKNAEGKEVGIKEVKSPSSTTKFYIKLNEIKVPWWTVIQDIYNPDMFNTMKDVYEKAYSSSVYSQFDDAMKRGNGIYIDVEDLFKSSEIRYLIEDDEETDISASVDEEASGHLVQAVLPNNRMSYVLPYYAIMDNMLANVQEYNKVYNASAYRTKIMQNGNVRTVGLLEGYFKSNLFLNSDEMNLFGFYDIYNVPYSTDFRRTVFNQTDIDTMSRSLWYNKDAFTDEEVAQKLEELDRLGKKFIVENRTLLNKVTDETFIKVFALYMSVQHNNLFKVPAARGIELMNIDTKDIIRLSLAPKSDVMHSISMSFGRFTFIQAGTFGTILMAFLLLIYYFTSLIRPVVMIILVGGLIFSYVWKKVMRYEQNHSFEGYIVSCALICLVNVIYALVIKVSVMLPDFGVDPIFSILMQIILQAAYTGVLYLIGYVVLKNCRDLGYFTYKTFYDAHMANKIQSITMSANKLVANSIFAPFSNTANNMRNDYLGNRRTAGLTGDDIYTRMQQNDENRYNDVTNNYNRRY